jgi:hypothetical protein
MQLRQPFDTLAKFLTCVGLALALIGCSNSLERSATEFTVSDRSSTINMDGLINGVEWSKPGSD